jgi:hypothetical protein
MSQNYSGISARRKDFAMLRFSRFLPTPIILAVAVGIIAERVQADNASDLRAGLTPSNVLKLFPDNIAQDSRTAVLTQGMRSRVNTPFIMVVRNPEAYEQMRRLLGAAPELEPDFFTTRLVVAGFLGQRYTGGHGVEVIPAGSKVRVVEKAPPDGSVVSQQLTNPYALVAVRTEGDAHVSIEPGGVWVNAMKSYKISKVTRAAAGRGRSLNLAGAVRVLRYESLATIFFNVKDPGKRWPDSFNEPVTVAVEQDGSFHSLGPEGQQSGYNLSGSFKDADRTINVDISSRAESTSVTQRYFVKGRAARR